MLDKRRCSLPGDDEADDADATLVSDSVMASVMSPRIEAIGSLTMCEWRAATGPYTQAGGEQSGT